MSTTSTNQPGTTHLLIDADDTLWENNIYFERATEQFIAYLSHSQLTREQVIEVLMDFERVNTAAYGYGSNVYTRSLEETFRTLIERDVRDEDIAHVVALGAGILENEMELIPHVETTLGFLQARFTLVLCTKGEQEEQQIKVDRSGLGQYFHQIEVMQEKSIDTYRQILDRIGARSEQCCMVGNSPKSDILPPLSLGMAAIFIPHDHTWQLEHDEIDRGHPRLTVLNRFVDLIDHFQTDGILTHRLIL
jgi:putative hydrolase of the HAD superfamily